MRLLLVNDDGINGEGILTLARELEKEHDITIVAPENQRSATSHSITLRQSIIVKKVHIPDIKSKAYSISGSPADCVRVALDKILDEPVDMVVSGINMGLNLGMDVLYSGTVSAAIEANIYDIPSIAISAELKDDKCNFDIAVKYVKWFINKANHRFLNSETVININTPCISEEEIKGIKVCRIGEGIYDYYFVEDEKDEEMSLIISGRRKNELEKDTDRYYLNEGYVTITPLQYDFTNFKLIEEVKSWV